MNWKDGEKLKDTKMLNTIENHWNVSLPNELKDIIKENDHANPPREKSLFKTASGEERVFAGLLYFNLDEKANVLNDYQSIQNRLPEKVFPFAEDPSGNFICLDYRNLDTKIGPRVVFWNHEYQLGENKEEIYVTTLIASSFNKFLDCLYKSEPLSDDFDMSQVKCSW